ncbi:MAG: hypothetical protein ACU841_09925 [Gammaproteobacteria bacterium]
MNEEYHEIQRLKNNLHELDHRIGWVSGKKREAERAVEKLGRELDQLNSMRLECTQDLHRLEANTCDMWENIGDGG